MEMKFILLIALMFLPPSLAEDLPAKKPGERTDRLTLKATGKATVNADLIRLRFSVSSVNEDAKDAQRRLDKHMSILRNEMNLDSVAAPGTFSISFHAAPCKMRYSDSDGYTYTQQCLILFSRIGGLTDSEIQKRLSTVIDQLAGIDIGGSKLIITYDVEDYQALSAKAYDQALVNIMARAKSAVQLSGRKLGKIRLISDESSSVTSDDPFVTTDTSSLDSVVIKTVTLYVEFELE